MNLSRALLTMTTMLTAQIALAHPVVHMSELRIDAAQAQAFDAAGRHNMLHSLREEPGVLAMHAVASLDRPGVVYMFEVYSGEAAYKHHVETMHYKGFVDTTWSWVGSQQSIATEPVFLVEKPASLSVVQRGRTPETRIVEVTVRRENLDAFRRIVTAGMRESMKVEPGVLAMYAVTRKDHPEQWIFFEIYASADAYASHRKTPHFMEYLRLTGDMLVDKGHIEVENIALHSRGGLHVDSTAPNK